jgi:hypothetical protein
MNITEFALGMGITVTHIDIDKGTVVVHEPEDSKKQDAIDPEIVATQMVNSRGFENAMDYVDAAIINNGGDPASDYWQSVKDSIWEMER